MLFRSSSVSELTMVSTDPELTYMPLDIRTYSVVSLNEECGLIQWVPNTIPVRSILSTLYMRRGKTLWVSDIRMRGPNLPMYLTGPQNPELRVAFEKVKAIANNREAADMFVKEVLSTCVCGSVARSGGQAHIGVHPDSLPSCTNGSRRPSRSRRIGLQAGCRTVVLQRSCPWSDTFWGKLYAIHRGSMWR